MKAPRYAFPWDPGAGTSVPAAGPTTLNLVSTKPGQVEIVRGCHVERSARAITGYKR